MGTFFENCRAYTASMQVDKSTFIAELEVGASYASLMSATSLFFTGILISSTSLSMRP
jgi:hypothetical protein